MLGFTNHPRYCFNTRVVRDGQPFGRIDGTAAVRARVEPPGLARMDVTETGSWTSGPHAGLTARNAWFAQYSPDESTIEIHQARGRAPDGGTSAYLLTLVGGPARWRTHHPHPCAEDSYSLTARTETDGLVVFEWTVTGPAKNDVLTTTYRPEP